MRKQHAAYNITTGEVLTSNHANHLKRWVAYHIDRTIREGGEAGIWVFAHGKNWKRSLAAKRDRYFMSIGLGF